MSSVLRLSVAAFALLGAQVAAQSVDPRLIESYRDALRVPDTALKIEVIRNLGTLPVTPENEVLTSALLPDLVEVFQTDRHPITRREAVIAIASFRVPGVLAALHEAAASPDANVRYEAVKSLALIGDETSLDALRATFSDTFPHVRREAARTLAAIQQRSVRPKAPTPR